MSRLFQRYITQHLTRPRVRYQHAVTQAERSAGTTEPRGGILGDDMGLGKTLTTLAVVANSLERGSAFALSDVQRQASPRGHLMASKATLVVVPSIRVYL